VDSIADGVEYLTKPLNLATIVRLLDERLQPKEAL